MKHPTGDEAAQGMRHGRIGRAYLARDRMPAPGDAMARAIRKAIIRATIMPMSKRSIFLRAPARARSNGSITPSRTWLSAWSPSPGVNWSAWS